MSDLGNKEVMAKNLAYYVERSGRSQKEVAEIIDVAPSTFNAWIKGIKYPRIDSIERLANYFGILKSDLIEEKTKDHREMQKKNDALADIVIRMRTDKRFFSLVSTLNDLNDEQIVGVAQMLRTFTK